MKLKWLQEKGRGIYLKVQQTLNLVKERSNGETSFPGHRLLVSNDNTHKDPNFPNGTKKNESQQGEQHRKAGKSTSMFELWTDPDFDGMAYFQMERRKMRASKVEAAYLSHRVVVPKADQGKFQIHNIEGIARTWDAIQAHLSNRASAEVLEVANTNRLSEIIILEELPRLRTWPSQFMRSQVTEDNIAQYFFAHDSDSYIYYEQLVNYMMNNDLALKGHLDGVELLIFPSNILPENFQCKDGMACFSFGVYSEDKRRITQQAHPVSNSLKLKKGDDMAIVDEIPEFESSGDTVLAVGENSDSKGGVANAEHAVVDINKFHFGLKVKPKKMVLLGLRSLLYHLQLQIQTGCKLWLLCFCSLRVTWSFECCI
ncbi:hypothetical protein D0Y65_002076 [Glycine soja]|uniref:AIPP2-like SPOC-like domain-containing protein n=1 Tax=Glycine soja TaxID=3848 RepID=A0A445M5J5_GLYSO|nr:hypothetical protein D0Y65_002076 [Glycine soja]RZC30857.1 hypothetical protein D0Y65_002076 [Glycine soja]